jgi:hypothetical protein
VQQKNHRLAINDAIYNNSQLREQARGSYNVVVVIIIDILIGYNHQPSTRNNLVYQRHPSKAQI